MCAVLLREHIGNKLYFSHLQACQASRHLSGTKLLPLSIFYPFFLMMFIFTVINFIVDHHLITIAVFYCLIVLFLHSLPFNL